MPSPISYNATGEPEYNDEGELIEAGDTVMEVVDGGAMIYLYRTPEAQILGGLLGVAVGDALGATVEFVPREQVAARYGRHPEIVGGGPFGWRPGQGTDDTDLTVAIMRAHLDGFSLERVAERFLDWYRAGPPDVGNTTRAALEHLSRHGDPTASGPAVAGEQAAGNGSLMRCIVTGLVRTDPEVRRREAAAISAITHADPRCVDACVAYCDLVAGSFFYDDPEEIIEWVLADSPIGPETRAVLERAPTLSLDELRPTGFVLDTLEVALWAYMQDPEVGDDGALPFEQTLADVVNLGGDADTTGAVAGGLLGVNYQPSGMPERWLDALEYRAELEAAAPALWQLRRESL